MIVPITIAIVILFAIAALFLASSILTEAAELRARRRTYQLVVAANHLAWFTHELMYNKGANRDMLVECVEKSLDEFDRAIYELAYWSDDQYPAAHPPTPEPSHA